MSEHVYAVQADSGLFWRWGQKWGSKAESKRLPKSEAERIANILGAQNHGHRFMVVEVGPKPE